MANVSLMIDREIPEHDGRILNTYCGPDIPDYVRLAYWHYKSIKDKGGLSVCSAEELAQVVLVARVMLDKPPHDNPLQPFNIAREANTFDPSVENNLRIWWRKKETKAQFISHNPQKKETTVLIYDDVSERTLDDDRILGLWPKEELVEA